MEYTIPKATSKTPIKIESLLQITVLTLVVLSTLLLSMGQQKLTYAFAALAAAVISFTVTDWKGYVRLGSQAASVASLLACLLLLVQVVRNVEQSQLLNVANILICLQIIMMFQKKNDRIYWSLLSLSLLQVIVAAALNLGLLFGILLSIYMLIAVAALAFFYVFRVTRPFTTAGQDTPQQVEDEKPSDGLVMSKEADVASQILNGSYIHRLMWMIFVTTLSTIVVFYAIPRFNNTPWESPTQDTSTVGFTNQVDLTDMSRILESPEQVMRVEFSTLGGEPYQIDTEPYLRGTVLSEYREDGGFWREFKTPQAIRSFNNRDEPDMSQVVLQHITLQPGSHSVLFNVAPCYATFADTPTDLQLNEHTRQLTPSENDDGDKGAYRYTLSTTAFRNGWQKDLIPVLRPLTQAHGDQSREIYTREEWLQKSPQITTTAEQVLAEQGQTEANAFFRAKALEEHFQISGQYSYSLDGSQERNPDLDPIEDFVANHRTGHCEYFASALTLMLRSQRIPARIVVGYKGGEFNTLGNYYIVRQLHAHAWVEAFLPAEEIPADELDPLDDYSQGAWLRLDPTPMGIDQVADDRGLQIITTVKELLDYCQVLWDDYVLGLNSNRQRQAIYGPLVRNFRTLGQLLFNREAWRNRFQKMQVMLGSPNTWLLLSVISLIIGFAYFGRNGLRRIAQVIRHRLPKQGWNRGRRGQRLDLYDQMERMLARHGFRRSPKQTAYEFAEATGGRLAETPIVDLAGVPRRVTNAHYRVRFGEQRLSFDEYRELQLALGKLEKALYGY
ncbi:MAG: DUF3488 domain-containing transglutaminase family protein [Planctomycetaceae bacterium]|nr:DUF3488 domain-containing transglutaminase family protein [Planctomycetaceae bacterium]